MSQIWRGVSGGIEVLENVNEMADIPDISTIDSEGVWYIESGEFGPDYIAPTNWDSSAGEFTNWFSLFDGQILADIPDVWTDNWPTDEGTGTTVSNDIGSNNITVDGAIWKDDVGRGGHYLAYNGSDDYSVSDSDANHFGVPTSSLACWFRPDSVGQGRGVVMGFPERSIQLEYDSDVGDGLSFIINDGADGGSSNIILNGPTVDAGEWVFAGVVIDESSGEAKLYSAFIEDSEVILSDSSSGYDNPSTFDVVSKMFVGGDGENDRRYFEGGVDDKYFASEGAASKSDFDETFSATADNYA